MQQLQQPQQLQQLQQLISVSELKPHPLNDYYFDDIKDDSWEDFLNSIKTSGVTNAITIDQNNRIISGHQRVRACRELNIPQIRYSRITYSPEELGGDYPKDVKDLIESNLKQRVAGNSNPVKLGRCFQFLEGWYGIKQGKKKKRNNFVFTDNNPKTQSELADKIGISEKTLQNYKQLAEAIPEIQELIETNKVTPTTARAIIKKLGEDDQRKLAAEFTASDKKVSSREVDFYIKQLKILREENEKLKAESAEPVSEPETITVAPADYDELKKRNEELADKIAALEKNNSSINNEKVCKETTAPISDLVNALLLKEVEYYKEQSLQLKQDRDILKKSISNNPYFITSNILESLSKIELAIRDEFMPLIYNDNFSDLNDVVRNEVIDSLTRMINTLNQGLITVNSGKNTSTIDIVEVSCD